MPTKMRTTKRSLYALLELLRSIRCARWRSMSRGRTFFAHERSGRMLEVLLGPSVLGHSTSQTIWLDVLMPAQIFGLPRLIRFSVSILHGRDRYRLCYPLRPIRCCVKSRNGFSRNSLGLETSLAWFGLVG